MLVWAPLWGASGAKLHLALTVVPPYIFLSICSSSSVHHLYILYCLLLSYSCRSYIHLFSNELGCSPFHLLCMINPCKYSCIIKNNLPTSFYIPVYCSLASLVLLQCFPPLHLHPLAARVCTLRCTIWDIHYKDLINVFLIPEINPLIGISSSFSL